MTVLYFCPYCGRETEHVNVSEAAARVHVTRRTIYNWLDRHLVHCVQRPSGRRFICVHSLVVPGRFRDLSPPEHAPARSAGAPLLRGPLESDV